MNFTSLRTCAATGRNHAAALPVTTWPTPPHVKEPDNYCWVHAEKAIGPDASFEQRCAFEHGFYAELAQRNLRLAEEYRAETPFFLDHDLLLLAMRAWAQVREDRLASFIQKYA